MIIGKVKTEPTLVHIRKKLVVRVQIGYYDSKRKFGIIELVAYNQTAKEVAVICKENVVAYFEAELHPIELGDSRINEFQITHIEKLYEGYKSPKQNIEFLKELDPLNFYGGKR